MKNGEVLSLYETLVELSKNKDLKLKVKIGYALAKNKSVLQEQARIIDDLRRNLIIEYGHRQEDGNYIIPKDKIDEVNLKINELMEIDSGIDEVKILKIPIDEIEEESLSLEQIEGLMPILLIPIMTGPPIIKD